MFSPYFYATVQNGTQTELK